MDNLFSELNIAGNQLVHLEASLLTNQCELENIHLGYSVSNGMDISSSLFYNNEELKRVDLTNGKSSIPSQLFIPLPKVEWLSLDGNFIPVLTPLLLRKKKKLEYLEQKLEKKSNAFNELKRENLRLKDSVDRKKRTLKVKFYF